jgi:hypothetical protein
VSLAYLLVRVSVCLCVCISVSVSGPHYFPTPGPYWKIAFPFISYCDAYVHTNLRYRQSSCPRRGGFSQTGTSTPWLLLTRSCQIPRRFASRRRTLPSARTTCTYCTYVHSMQYPYPGPPKISLPNRDEVPTSYVHVLCVHFCHH